MKRHTVDLDPEDGDFWRCPFTSTDGQGGVYYCEHPENRNPRWQEDGQKMYLIVQPDECPHEYRAPMDERGYQAYMKCAAPACPLRREPIQIEGNARLKFVPCQKQEN